jgi:vancomycin resistance protein YoaR
VIVPSVDGGVCCAPDAVGTIVSALRSRPAGRVTLPLKVVSPGLTTAGAEALGVKEVVSSFTTKHPCCAARVQNIHKLADMVKGVLIKPGQSFSFNDFIGVRTVERGWVIAPTIIDGALAPSPGGGISQFMTTTFNTAWFAGLDFAEYSSHSIYISRYPFGREATISWPSPDLKLTNSTPYGVMLWTSYTETSVTVTMYSTKYFAKVEQGHQSAQLSGKSCSSITTPRIRTYLDGTVKTDLFYARYQAREGLLCTDPLPPGVSPIAVPGQPPPSVPPSATTTTVAKPTTTAPATTTTTLPPTTPPPTT